MLSSQLPMTIGSAGCDGAPEGRWDHPVPGCLTGESEERETWTAGSLRAASSREGAAGRDFGGTRFRSHHGSRKRSEVTDLVKRCDQPVQVLIQPESLILAQSERWRQA